MSRILVLTLFLLLALGGVRHSYAGEDAPDLLESAQNLYFARNFEDALPAFEVAALVRPDDPDVRAWLAETLRRLDRDGEAMVEARAALDLDSCHAFAHEIVASLHHPLFGNRDLSDEDLAWRHYHQAVDCDTTDGHPWLSIWTLAIGRGDEAREREALRRLASTKFFSSAAYLFARWTLRDLPDDAVLLVNGDMDTYPLLVLQETEGFRPDVAVLNLSLVNARSYAEMMATRYDLPTQHGDLRHFRDADGTAVRISHQIMTAWMEKQRSGEWARPLAVCVTVDDDHLTEDWKDRFLFCGPWYLAHRAPPASPTDADFVRRTLDGFDWAGLAEPTNPRDRSPYRRSSRMGLNVIAAMIAAARADVANGRIDDARRMIESGEQLAATLPGGRGYERLIQEVREAVTDEE